MSLPTITQPYGLGNVYWAEAVTTATYLCNHIVSTALKVGETP